MCTWVYFVWLSQKQAESKIQILLKSSGVVSIRRQSFQRG